LASGRAGLLRLQKGKSGGQKGLQQIVTAWPLGLRFSGGLLGAAQPTQDLCEQIRAAWPLGLRLNGGLLCAAQPTQSLREEVPAATLCRLSLATSQAHHVLQNAAPSLHLLRMSLGRY
jgi:hypothetical protein